MKSDKGLHESRDCTFLFHPINARSPHWVDRLARGVGDIRRSPRLVRSSGLAHPIVVFDVCWPITQYIYRDSGTTYSTRTMPSVSSLSQAHHHDQNHHDSSSKHHLNTNLVASSLPHSSNIRPRLFHSSLVLNLSSRTQYSIVIP